MTCSELPGGSISVAQRAARASTVEPTGRGCAGQTGGVAAVGRPGHGAVRTGPQTKRAPRDRNPEALHQAPRVQEGPERSTEAVAGSVEEDGGWMAGWLDGSMARR